MFPGPAYGPRRGGQLGEVAGVHTHDIEFRNAALDGGGVCFGGGYLHFAAGQAAHHVAQQFAESTTSPGSSTFASMLVGDAHFQVVAGKRQAEALGFHQDAFQHRNGAALGDGFGHACHGVGQQGAVTDHFHKEVLLCLDF